MSEMPCGSDHDDRDHRMATYATRQDAIEARIARFHRRVEEVTSGEGEPRDDDYMYTDPELIEAYAILETRCRDAVRALIALYDAERRVNKKRRELQESCRRRDDEQGDVL